METSHFPSPSRGRERYRASGHEAACAGNTRLFARAEAARVTAMLLLVASGNKGPVVPLAVSLRIQAARSAAKRHPAVFPLLLTRPAATPAARTARDSVQEALHEAGLAADEAARAERPDQRGRPRLRRQRGGRTLPPSPTAGHRRGLRRTPALAQARPDIQITDGTMTWAENPACPHPAPRRMESSSARRRTG